MSFENKILYISELKKLRSKFKRKKIVLCHGVFDLLHIGHINYFKAAKKLGDILVVSVTNNKFVNKGPGRPAFDIQNRINFLKEINCVNFVCVSHELTSEKIIRNLKPNFYCKGNDYSKDQMKFDKNLIKEIRALKINKGQFKIIAQESFSSSQFINEYNFQNFDQECSNYIKSIRKKINLNQLIKNLEIIKNKKVLVIGETIIDRYVTTEAIGKSGKEPMLVLKPKKEIKFLGGAGYIANLCSGFVKELKIISFLGKENTEKKFVLKNLNKNINHDFLLKRNSPTINKLRYLDDYKKTKILGIYNLNDDLISKVEEKRFYNLLKKNINKFDILIISDYGHGIITKKIKKLLLKQRNKIFLNAQINSFNRGYNTVLKYKKINTLVINESELRYELRDKHSGVQALAKKLSKIIYAKNIVITKGKSGSTFINTKNNSLIYCPAFNKNNIDTIGAGDSFFAILSLVLGSGLDIKTCMLIGSLAASFSIDQQGKKTYFDSKTLNKHLTHIFK